MTTPRHLGFTATVFVRTVILLLITINRSLSFIVTPLTLTTTRTSITTTTTPTIVLSASNAQQTITSTTTTTTTPATLKRIWRFRDQYDIYTEVTNPSSSFSNPFIQPKKPSVILIHGFGCSTVYWRETTQSLASQGYTVHAIDLLGQGRSSKPGREEGIEYSIDLWAELVMDYAKDAIDGGGGVVLMGNSLGSVVALSAATGDYTRSQTMNDEVQQSLSSTVWRDRIRGICLFNCGVGMNSRNIIRDPEFNSFQRQLLTGLFDLLDALIFNNRLLLGYVLDKVVTPELLRDALRGLYRRGDPTGLRVDDELVNSFYEPAKEKGSVEALSQIYTNDPGSTPMEIYERHADFFREGVPIHVVWGDEDGVTPLTGSVGRFFSELAKQEGSDVSLDVVESGHIPFDEVPGVSNGSMIRWLEDVVVEKGRVRGETARFGAIKLPFFT